MKIKFNTIVIMAIVIGASAIATLIGAVMVTANGSNLGGLMMLGGMFGLVFPAISDKFYDVHEYELTIEKK